MEKQNIITAIEFNWNCLLITRAVFSHRDFGTNPEYESPGFYASRNILVKVKWQELGEFQSKFEPKKLNYWHNANFIIRLYGILDEHKLFIPDNRKKYASFELLHFLRNKVGAHQDGLKKRKKKYLSKMNRLFKELNIKEVDTLKMKDALIEDIRNYHD